MTSINDPTAYADQEQAARRELGTVLAGIATIGAAATGHAEVSIGDTPAWLAMRVAQLREAISAGNGRACTHLMTGPRPIVHALWHPTIVACPDCAPALFPDPHEDSVCGRCRTPVALIHPRAAAHGLMLILFGLCEPCRRADEGPAPKRHKARHGRAHPTRQHRRRPRR
jgi:hypothetical protein